jgi:hypothetical protein
MVMESTVERFYSPVQNKHFKWDELKPGMQVKDTVFGGWLVKGKDTPEDE